MRIFLILLLSVIGLTAIISGGFMIMHPDRTDLNLPLSILRPAPFEDFLVAGWLLLCIGAVHFYALLKWWRRSNERFNWSVAAGLIISGWIVMQMIMVAIVNWWQLSYLFAGMLIVLTSWQLKGKWIV